MSRQNSNGPAPIPVERRVFCPLEGLSRRPWPTAALDSPGAPRVGTRVFRAIRPTRMTDRFTAPAQRGPRTPTADVCETSSAPVLNDQRATVVTVMPRPYQRPPLPGLACGGRLGRSRAGSAVLHVRASVRRLLGAHGGAGTSGRPGGGDHSARGRIDGCRDMADALNASAVWFAWVPTSGSESSVDASRQLVTPLARLDSCAPSRTRLDLVSMSAVAAHPG